MNIDLRPKRVLYAEALDAALENAEAIRYYMTRKRDCFHSGRHGQHDDFIPIVDAYLSDLIDHLSGNLRRMEENK